MQVLFKSQLHTCYSSTVIYSDAERNLVPRALDPREGTRCSGIIRFREESDLPLKWMRSSILARIPGFRQRIIPEPHVPSRGSQARGTRLRRTHHFIWMRSGNSELAYCSSLQKHRIEQRGIMVQ
jgi:hypothetical protein